MGDGAEEWSQWHQWDCVILGLKSTIDILGRSRPINTKISAVNILFAISPTFTTSVPVT